MDIVHNDCKYRFKGKSCEECSLDCHLKDKNWLYLFAKQLKAENEELKAKKDEYYLDTLDYERANSILVNCLEEIKEIASAKCPQISDEECNKNKRYGCEECYSRAIRQKIEEVLK